MNQILASVVVFEIFMVGMFSLYSAPVCSIIMACLIVVTVAYWRVLTVAFNRPQRVMSMTAAAEMDKKNGVLDISAAALQRVYKPPVMRDNGALPSVTSSYYYYCSICLSPRSSTIKARAATATSADAIHDKLMEQAQQVLDKISADPGYQSLTAIKEIPSMSPRSSNSNCPMVSHS